MVEEIVNPQKTIKVMAFQTANILPVMTLIKIRRNPNPLLVKMLKSGNKTGLMMNVSRELLLIRLSGEAQITFGGNVAHGLANNTLTVAIDYRFGDSIQVLCAAT